MHRNLGGDEMSEELALIETQTSATLDVVEAVDVPAFYQQASCLTITPDEQAALLADFDADEIEIRPDGLIYLPQSFFRSRLNSVFGVGQWALIQHRTHMDDAFLYFDGSLYVRGCFVARAMGEGKKHGGNEMQSWAGVYESAKSDCIVRCCKDLSIAAKLWQPAFTREWVDKRAIKVWQEYEKPDRNGKKGKFVWRRKDAPPFYWEKGNKAPQSDERPKATSSPAPAKKARQKADTGQIDVSEWIGREGQFPLPEGAKKGVILDELDLETIYKAREHYTKTKSPYQVIFDNYVSKLPNFAQD